MSPTGQRSNQGSKGSNQRRNPRQGRSLERVETILAAASSLISEQGGGALKMAAIAQRAGVTTGSIYQYFSNTREIVRALAETYAERFRDAIRKHLQQVHSAEDLITHSRSLFNEFCEMYRSEPVLKEIGLATSLDKDLQGMDILDSRQNAALLFQAYEPYFAAESRDELQRLLFLMCHLTGASIRLALALDDKEGIPLLASHQQMLEARFLELMKP